MPVITVDAAAGYAYAAGFRGDGLVTITAVMGPESGYNTTAHNPNASTGDDSYGLCQINMLGSLGPARRREFGLKNNSDLFDPATNLRAAWSISGGGKNFQPWTTFKRGAHRSYLAKAEAAAKAVTARNGGAAASGAPSLEQSTLGQIAGERIPPGAGLKTVPPYTTPFPAMALDGGPILNRALQVHGISGRVTMSASAVTEVEMKFIGARETGLWRSLITHMGARLADMNLVVASTGWSYENDVEIYSVILRPAAVAHMREPIIGDTWADMSPTEVMYERAAGSGLRFYGKGTPRRTQVVRLGAEEAGRDKAESDWELGQRLAREEGFWFFEAGGAIYFAPPTWLAEKGTRFPVRHRAVGAEAAWNTLGGPDLRKTIDEARSSSKIVSSGTFPLPRWRGEQVRPGMVVDYAGTPGYETASTGVATGLLVTDVSWDLDAGESPVTVDVTAPIDPVPQPPEQVLAMNDGTESAIGVGASAAGDGVGSNVSNGGKGTYGYQYDPPGDTAATGPQPGAKVLMAHLLRKFPQSHNSGIFVDKNVSGTGTKSVHAEGRAGDSGVPVSSQYGTSMANYLVANASLMGIQYVIWNGRSWRATTRTWKTYTPPNGKTDNTSMHRDHVHWELCWEAARYLNDAALSGAYGST